MGSLKVRTAGLTGPQRRFVAAYSRDYDLDRALFAAHIRSAELAEDVLNSIKVRAEVERLRNERLLAYADDLCAQDIIKRLQLIAFADPGELIEHRRTACAECWLGSHTDDDLIDPECPRCKGEGESRVYLADTRYLSAAGKAIYGGVKIRHGTIEVVMRDQVAALEALGRIYGVFEADNRQKQDGLQKLVEYVQANSKGLPMAEVVEALPRPDIPPISPRE